jgi:pyruvate dehydrogenase kinase 2/3/4
LRQRAVPILTPSSLPCSAIIKLKSRMQEQSLSLAELPEIHSFLDGFYLSRIGIRMLIGQHVSLHEERRDGYIGAINTQCDPCEVAHQAIECASGHFA